MKKGVWSYTVNQFDNKTRHSFTLMDILNSDHLSKLGAYPTDADIQMLYVRTKPLHDDFQQKHALWTSAKAAHEGKTSAMNLCLRELMTDKIKEWDIQIQVHHMKGTPAYKTILPNGRSAYQRNTIDERISLVNALSMTLEKFPELAATKTDVDDFFNTMATTRDEQQSKEGLVKNASMELEKARKAIAVMMYRNMAILMDKYGDKPERISAFFEVELLKSRRRKITEENE